MQCYAMLCNAVRCYAMPCNATHSYRTQWRAIHCLCVRRNVADTEKPNGTRSWKSPRGCRPGLSQVFRAVDCSLWVRAFNLECLPRRRHRRRRRRSPERRTHRDGAAPPAALPYSRGGPFFRRPMVGNRTPEFCRPRRSSVITILCSALLAPHAGQLLIMSSLYCAARSWHHTRVSC